MGFSPVCLLQEQLHQLGMTFSYGKPGGPGGGHSLLEVPEGAWEYWPGASSARQAVAKRDQYRGLRCHVLGTPWYNPGAIAGFCA